MMRSPFVGLLCALGLLGGCFDNRGIDPPAGRFAFPIALALRGGSGGRPPDRLLVVSSNFDLHYNAGAVHSLDLDALASCGDCRFEEGCFIVPEGSDLEARGGHEARRCPGLLVSEVLLDSFASDATLAPQGDRLYVTVRSRASLTVVDVDEEGALGCGEAGGERPRCDRAHRIDGRLDGQGEGQSTEALPADPVAVLVEDAAAVSEAGCDRGQRALWTVHRGGQVGLLLDPGDGGLPVLLDVVEGLGRGLAGAALRSGRTVWAASRATGAVGRVHTELSCEQPARSALRSEPPLRLDGIDTLGASAPDVRAVVLRDGEGTVGDAVAYVVSRDPRALVAVDVDASERQGHLVPRWTVPMCRGASELRRTTMRDEAGEARDVLWVSCFDARRVEIFDARDGRHLANLQGPSGPYDVAFDEARGRLYVADFSASVLRVYDVEPLRRCLLRPDSVEAGASCAPTLDWVVGVPVTVRELR